MDIDRVSIGQEAEIRFRFKDAYMVSGVLTKLSPADWSTRNRHAYYSAEIKLLEEDLVCLMV